jgi:predicted nucleic acid-binding protein
MSLTPEPPASTIVAVAARMREKDAPILAAAMHSPAKYLVTLDYRDLLRPEVRSLAPTLTILSPGNFVRDFVSA